ncbi:MAG: sulfotransferase [Deltaproteobacteria bacterium]|nr:sulfotransferase [Deltaproteobacteria bacterium]
MSNLVFIAGPGRSGSTILQASLDSHPELLVFPLEFDILFTFKKIEREKGIVLVGDFVNYLYKNTRFYYLGKVMPMDFGDNLDLTKVSSEIFWKTMMEHEKKIVTPSDIIDIIFHAFNKSLLNINEKIKYFVIRSNNLFLSEYRKYFKGAKYLYTIRNPVDLFIGYLKYHSTSGYSWGHFKVYNNLTENILNLIKIYLTNEMMNYDGNDTMKVKLEELVGRSKDVLDHIIEFLEIKYDDILKRYTLLGRNYSGNKIQKMSPKEKGIISLLKGRGYITNKEFIKLERLIRNLPECCYDKQELLIYAKSIRKYMFSVYYMDIIRKIFYQLVKFDFKLSKFSYLFPRDYNLLSD